MAVKDVWEQGLGGAGWGVLISGESMPALNRLPQPQPRPSRLLQTLRAHSRPAAPVYPRRQTKAPFTLKRAILTASRWCARSDTHAPGRRHNRRGKWGLVGVLLHSTICPHCGCHNFGGPGLADASHTLSDIACPASIPWSLDPSLDLRLNQHLNLNLTSRIISPTHGAVQPCNQATPSTTTTHPLPGLADEPITLVRPSPQHRHSSNITGSLPKPRPHAHSVSMASLNPAHRVTRRKSMSSTAGSNVAALAAAAKGMSGAPLESPSAMAGTTTTTSSSRRMSKPALQFRGPSVSLHPPMGSSMPGHGSPFSPGSYSAAARGEALTDGPALASMPEHEQAGAKSRTRRASEGSRLAKGDGSGSSSKRTSGSDLRCEKCGKGYKHSSCLTKHLWEHTPEWQYTSKLLISKHQQVQLLEAASVLVAMNKESDAGDSDHSSASPAASASSGLRDGLSSTETTPPPQLDDHAVGSFRSQFAARSVKRYSATSSAYGQSYQSTVFSDNGNAGHFRHWSNVSDRPTTSGTSLAGSYHDDGTNDPSDLAAAVGLLSCSYGTPTSGPVALPSDVPPVPPLPAKFLSFSARTLSGNTIVTPQQSSMRNSYRYHSESKDVDVDVDVDVDMDDDQFADEEDYRQSNSRSRGRADEDDDAFFGRMEE
ncbi:hypothetical protein P153DRAFT_360227 [Dothidotthia symphoricarpi CBS 119687]|uniref:C2H2-type domain-containing protein n=1 Tax=Dothidotthia symphoricarpi CBS 119687 TaxID=1392245 RepID=A0A6A6A302_9PLEO|nr:uncharacterized protein P153DRAFT_360227 [Dothidotthia symphoricarpi CBS 119687]KAF2125926.1 hypothetical protein P153DRAFT_360227 [Dothidotthia symphoricarpi CBS 119687]